MWVGVSGQVFVGTPAPPQFSRQEQPSARRGEWRHYNGDLRGSRYSPLDQINASNFSTLQIAWRFKTDNFGPFPEYKLEGTPLMVQGVLYATAGTRRSVVALDATTGEIIWSHSLREGKRAGVAPRQLSGRGLSYWTDGRGDDRIIYVTTGYRLVELNARTGAPITSFGTGGIVDLKVGVVKGADQQIDLETGEIGLHSTPAVAGNVVIVGSSFREGFTVATHDNTKGLVRGFDVRTGRKLWQFNTIPRPGEFGNETWENGSWAANGNVGVWSEISVDEELGLVYLPVETPTSDFYGGHRPGNNLFAESLVCVDLKTGQRKWHFQFVHHPIWNYDVSSAPILADVTVNGQPLKVVAVPSKQSFLYVFDRVTGRPVWPIEERAVPQSDIPGEKTSATQPFPTKPPAYSRNQIAIPDDLIDFTPEMRVQALTLLERYRFGPMYNPPMLGKATGLLGAVNIANAIGGTNWTGGGYDPETHTVFVPAVNANTGSYSLAAPPSGFSDITYVRGVDGLPFAQVFGPGDCCSADSGYRTRDDLPAAPAIPAGVRAPPPLAVQGLPIVKPPYGVLAAIDLDRGDLLWRVANGETPDNVRNHPALKGMSIPKTGQAGNAGLVVTKTLVISGEPLFTTTPEHPRGAMLRAYDKRTGKEVGAVYMPAPQSGSPMTYQVGGKQYLVVAVSAIAGQESYSGEYIAYRLPD
ncbi:MAG: pyrroloquinoline quinone-dependent dehydrogenase [Acidobacteria bacterium]|nr:pyrroloquinoline quinone-dependent dehydrogenase [Acidobacteriota bacterium]